VALSGHPAVSAGPLAFAGPMVLGLYAVHIFFVDLLRPLDRAWTGTAGWEIAYPLIVFALALGATYALSRRSATRALVM
jgi:hypothetical protein